MTTPMLSSLTNPESFLTFSENFPNLVVTPQGWLP